MMDKRDVYRSNLNLLTNLCIILSTQSIEDIGEGFQEYDNFEFCSDALIKVIEHVNETAYIERSIYSQLKVVAKKAYDLCLPIVTQYMKEKEYMLLRQNNKLALMQHSSKADIDNHMAYMQINSDFVKECIKFIDHKSGYLSAILRIVNSNDYSISCSSMTTEVMYKLYMAIPEFKKELMQIKKVYKVKNFLLVTFGMR